MEEVFRILLVDDDARVHEMVAKISSFEARRAGIEYRLDYVSTPDEANTLVGNNAYDLVIINGQYGELGYWPRILPDSFLDNVMKMKEQGCVVVSYSGLGLNNQQELWKSRKEGFVDRYIAKNDSAELIDCMKRFMNKWRNRRKS